MSERGKSMIWLVNRVLFGFFFVVVVVSDMIT